MKQEMNNNTRHGCAIQPNNVFSNTNFIRNNFKSASLPIKFTFHNNSHNKISINCTPTSKKYNTFTQKNSLLNNKTKLVDDLYFSATEDDEEILCTKCR